MRKQTILFLTMLTVAAAAQPLQAQGERFAIRFGVILLDSTSGSTNELDTVFGGEFDFEWYFLNRLGLEGSVATAVEADLINNNEDVAGVTITPVTAGLNGHIVRSERVDWYIGVVAGGIIYSDFEVRGNTTTVTTDSEPTYGLQTAVDIGVAKQGRWGINIGVKYLKADIELTQGLQTNEVAIDPLIFRAMGTFRW